jgi:hypothetical protein
MTRAVMEDRLGVTRYPVSVTPVAGQAQRKLLARLDLMERELAHIQTAIRDMKLAVRQGSSSLLARAVMNSRNWVLSLVISHSYIQMILGANAGSPGFPGAATTLPGFQLDLLFGRAAKAGVEDGLRDRQA